MNIRNEIKQFVDDVFELQWDTDEIPFTRHEFINILTEKFQELNEKTQKEQLLESMKNKFNTFKLN